jgi:hypothetical protein
MKSIVMSFALTVTCLAVASAVRIQTYGVHTAPSRNIEMGGAPFPCGLPGLPTCPGSGSRTETAPVQDARNITK